MGVKLEITKSSSYLKYLNSNRMFHVAGHFFSSNFAAGFGPKVKAIFRFGNRPKPRDSMYLNQ